MRRAGKRVPLNVLLNGRQLGILRMERSGAVSFVYDDSWLSWEHALPVSLSLPLQEQAHIGAPIIAYLENLLPDNQVIRDRIAAKVGSDGTDAYNLLAKLGRDCVGALQFVADDQNANNEKPGEIHAEPVTDSDVAETLNNLTTSPLGIKEDSDFRISIAGAQEKTALLRMNGKWFRPSGMTPTSHILKTQLGQLPNGINLSDSVENEFFCMRFCAAMGAEVANVEIVEFEDVRALAIERFDRQWTSDGRLLRIPQEDFCQAMAYPPSQKYQSDGGPSVVDGLELLAASDDPTADQISFIRAQVVFWLLGATDGHAKNFSIRLGFGGGFKMTPLYDVLSAQRAFDKSQIKHSQYKLAMSLGRSRNYRIDQIAARHVFETAKEGSIGEMPVKAMLEDILSKVPDAIHATTNLMADDFPEELSAAISKGIHKRSQGLERTLNGKETENEG
mgnify:CR=1 FL=1